MESTQLYVRYSPIYDRTLAQLAGQQLSNKEVVEGQSFTQKFSDYWKPINQKVFDYYRQLGLTLASYWMAYPVHQRPKLIPFNDPLTVVIKKDLQEVAATVIHEICHTFFTYFANQDRAKALWSPVQQAYPKEKDDVQEHVVINILAGAGYHHVFGKTETQQLINLERTYPSLQRSWDIIALEIGNDYSLLSNPVGIINNLTHKT